MPGNLKKDQNQNASICSPTKTYLTLTNKRKNPVKTHHHHKNSSTTGHEGVVLTQVSDAGNQNIAGVTVSANPNNAVARFAGFISAALLAVSVLLF